MREGSRAGVATNPHAGRRVYCGSYSAQENQTLGLIDASQMPPVENVLPPNSTAGYSLLLLVLSLHVSERSASCLCPQGQMQSVLSLFIPTEVECL